MRVKVQRSWRTRVLIALAALAATFMAWWQVSHQPPRRPAPRRIEIEIQD